MRNIYTLLFLVIPALFAGKNTFAQATGTFKDSRDGHIYKTVKIGDQVWMAENLAYQIDGAAWPVDDDENNVGKYGYFYKWETALDVCPPGWRLPSKTDFETLIARYGGKEAAYTALIENGSSGFSALLAGWRGSYGGYSDKGGMAAFWSSSKSWNHYRWALGFFSDEKSATVFDDYDTRGFSVRCLKKK